MDELIQLVEGFGAPRVVLVGDFMLDRYVFGDARRVSPEAPVPVLQTVREESRAGGAGNVASAILALGGSVVCVGVTGMDDAGEQINRLLVSAGTETASLLRLKNHFTTVKTRYVGLAQQRHPQQMLRVDDERSGAITKKVAVTIRGAARDHLAGCDVLAIEDYDKGLLVDDLCRQIISDARNANVPVIVDPARDVDYSRYVGATLLTPNRMEAEIASGVHITDDRSLAEAAATIIECADAQAVVITLDREGAFLMERSGEGRRIPTRPRSVYDVTGAGDEVLAMLSVATAEGCDFEKAVALANVAGALEVERFGVVAIKRKEVLDELRRMIGLRGHKVLSQGKLAEEIKLRKSRGETVVFTNGCFDLLHMGHVRYLKRAREMGTCLIVAINSDDSVARLKGPGRPVIGAEERAEMLGALECVDFVTVFEEDTPIPLIEILQPDLLVKGGTTPQVVGREVVEGYGGKVLTLEAVEGMSTTQIIDRIVETRDKD